MIDKNRVCKCCYVDVDDIEFIVLETNHYTSSISGQMSNGWTARIRFLYKSIMMLKSDVWAAYF